MAAASSPTTRLGALPRRPQPRKSLRCSSDFSPGPLCPSERRRFGALETGDGRRDGPKRRDWRGKGRVARHGLHDALGIRDEGRDACGKLEHDDGAVGLAPRSGGDVPRTGGDLPRTARDVPRAGGLAPRTGRFVRSTVVTSRKAGVQVDRGPRSSSPTALSSKPTARSSKPTARSSKPTARSSKPTARPSKPTARSSRPTARSSRPTARRVGSPCDPAGSKVPGESTVRCLCGIFGTFRPIGSKLRTDLVGCRAATHPSVVTSVRARHAGIALSSTTRQERSSAR